MIRIDRTGAACRGTLPPSLDRSHHPIPMHIGDRSSI
jgi:hypothetical protein